MLKRRNYAEILTIFLFCFTYFFAVKLVQFQNFGLHNDFCNYQNILQNSISGRFLLMNDIGFDCNFFGLHGTYIILAVIPLYWLIQSPILLLFLHAFGLSLAIIPLYLLTLKLLDNNIAAILISMSFVFSRIVNYGLGYDVHPESCYPFFFLTAFLMFEKEKYPLYLVFLFLALLIKEDAYIKLN